MTVRPQTVDRLFLHLHRAGLPGQIYWYVVVSGEIERDVLARALHATLAEEPRLSSTVVSGWLRHARKTRSWTLDEVRGLVVEGPFAGDERQPIAERWDLAKDPPIRVAMERTADRRTRIVMALHHSVSDALGALEILKRLGEHCRAIESGRALRPRGRPGATRGYGAFFFELSGSARWRLVRRFARQLAGMISFGGYRTGSSACATFADSKEPGCVGPLQFCVVRLPWEQVGRLLRVALRYRGTLTDLLLAVVLRAGCRVWPDASRPVVHASVPLSLRNSSFLGNPVLPNNVLVPWPQDRRLDELMSMIVEQSGRRRGVEGGLFQAAERMMLSVLPPWLASLLIRRAFAGKENTRETLTFTSLGQLEPCIREFGDRPVADAYCVGSLLAPPGLKIAVVPATGSLNLVIHWLGGVTGPEQIKALISEIKFDLDGLLSEPAVTHHAEAMS